MEILGSLKTYNELSEKDKLEITAAGLSRVYEHIQNSQSSTISACRNYNKELWNTYDHKDIATGKITDAQKEPFKVTSAENKARDKKLRADLKANSKNVGYIRISGTYQKSASDKASNEVSYS